MSLYAFTITLLALLSSTSRAQVAGCEVAFETKAVDRRMADAELAFTNLDVEGFFDASDDVRLELGCLSEPVSRKLAARFHRYEGLRFVLERNPASAGKSFAAARFIEPDYRFPTSLVPAGNPVHEHYLKEPITSVETLEAPPPAEGSLTLDGSAVLERRSGWPTIIQFLDDSGAVTTTLYVRAQEPLPLYAVAVPDDIVPEPLPSDPARPMRDEPVVPLAIAAGSALVVSGVSMGLAASANSRFWDDETPYDDLAAVKGRSNAFMGLSIGSGVFALGAGTGLIITLVN